LGRGARRRHVYREQKVRQGKPIWLHRIRVETQYVYWASKHYEDTPKTKRGTRTVTISEATYNLLMAHFANLEQLAALQWDDWTPNDLAFPNFSGKVIQPGNLRRAYQNLITSFATC